MRVELGSTVAEMAAGVRALLAQGLAFSVRFDGQRWVAKVTGF